ncbi:MAG TPA: phage holin family protein [Candidatus Dormibacteraeota bacterium]|nr:phage holin family protein [Candidatus Dormibacteraeota bacterium]
MSTSSAGPASYRSLIGDIRDKVRAYIAKQLLLPRQEIAEIVQANMRAAAWMGAGVAVLLLGLVAFVVFLITVLALLPREALGAVVLALTIGIAVALLVAGFRMGVGGFLAMLIVGVILVALGAVAFLFLERLILSAFLMTLIFFAVAAGLAFAGYRRLVLRGPERSIRSFKETISWVRATLLGQSES